MATAPAPQRNFFQQKAYRFLAALVFRDFRFLAVASLASGSGAWALIVARGAWVYSIPELQGTWGPVGRPDHLRPPCRPASSPRPSSATLPTR